MEVMTAQRAKTVFGELLMKVQREPVEISKNGKRVAYMISAEDYDLLIGHIRAAVDEGMADIEAGRVVDGPQFMEELRARSALRAKGKLQTNDL